MKTISKTTTILLIILTYKFGYSQNWDSIKKSDTIYIYINHGKYQTVKNANPNDSKIFKEVKNYEIKFDEKNFINFSEREYLDLDAVTLNKKMDKKFEKKIFFKKKRDLIIDLKFITKYGLEKVYFLIYKN